ncbi:MAG: DMT family transporter [Dongiaceae bacterium]
MAAAAKSPHGILPPIAVLISAAFWGSLWIPLRQIEGGGLSGVWASILVYGTPALLMLPLLVFGRGRLGSFGLLAFWVGATSGICNTFYSLGVIYGEVGKVVLLFYLNPVWSALLERMILKTPISKSRQVTILLGFIGMGVLVGNSSGLPIPRNLAEWFGVFAGIFWAASLVGMRFGGSGNMMPKTFFQFLFGALSSALILLLGWFPGDMLPGAAPLIGALPWVSLAVLIWILPAMMLSFWAVSFMSPTRASILFMLEAVVGVVTAALLTNEPFGWREIIGGLLILGAGLLDVLITGGGHHSGNGRKLEAAAE